MALEVGQKLDEATFVYMGDSGPAQLRLSSITSGKKIVLVGMPGAFTGVCNNHLPTFVSHAQQLRDKGIDEIVVFAVNDVFALKAWGDQLGAFEAGIKLVADGKGDFTRALGRQITVSELGLYDRCARFAALVQDGVVTLVHEDKDPNSCDLSSAQNLLNAL